jgi:cyclic nucleotide-binding protein
MPRAFEHFWRLLPAVRRAERAPALFFTTLLALVTAAQTVGLAGSEALFLARLSAQRLPLAFVIAAVAAMLGSALYAAVVGAVRNDSLFAGMLFASGLTLLGVELVVPDPGAGELFALIAAYYLTQCVLINHFWTFAGDYFDTLTSKRLVPVFALGSSVGGLFGGVVGAYTAGTVGPLATIGMWGALLCVAAAQLALARRPLRRWGPILGEEADETSVASLAAAVRYVRGSRLGRWLLLSSLGMVLAQFVAQYVYSDVFVRSHPDPTELAVFIAVFLALSNLVEIALEIWVTPWLIRRFGVASSHVVHPALTLVSFGALFASARLDTAIAARANRELVENALAQPVRTLVFNALPARFRGRIRAFLEGVVVYGGMSAAGMLLFAIETPDLRALAVVGAGASLLYLFANFAVRRAYLDALVEGIRTGSLDLGDLDEDIGAWESGRLADLCDELARAETARASRPLLQLIASLGQRGIAPPLVRALSHPLAVVRAACARALGECEDAHDALRAALSDRDAAVRLAALAALPGDADLAPLLGDPDPRVRAAAAARSPATTDQLVEMLEGTDRAARLAALAVAGAAHAPRIAQQIGDDDPEVSAAALERLVALEPARVPEGAIARALEAGDARVRCAALRAATVDRRRFGGEAIARALRDPDAAVRERASEALAASGDEGVEAALPYLEDASEAVAGAALGAVASGTHPRRHQLLSSELRRRVALAWHALAGVALLAHESEPRARFVRLAASDTFARHRRFAFRMLEQLETPRVVRRVERALRFGNARARANALEVLSNLGDRTAGRLLVLLHEPGPLEERLAALGPTVRVPASRDAFLADARQSDDPWLSLALAALDARVGDTPRAETAIMERLLALQRVPLFENLSLDQLDAVLRLARDATFLAGELIVREGDRGGELFLLLEGSAEVWLDYRGDQPRQLSTMRAGSYFGEMAILDDEPRSATVVAHEAVRLLALDGDSLKSLLREMPEIALELLKVMTARVRVSERRLQNPDR